MGKILKGLAAWVIALIVIVVIVVAAVGIYYGITLTSHHPTVTTTTPTTSVTTISTTVPSVTTTVPSPTTIVFYNWWATTGKVALEHVLSAFEQQYPNISVKLLIIPGGGSVDFIPVMLSLIEVGKPPEIFQSIYGPNMASWVTVYPGGPAAGLKAFVNWTPYYETHLAGKVIPTVFEAGALAGTLLSMPVQIHTTSLLYINIKVLRHYGLPIPTNISQLINDTIQLAKDGFYNSTNAPWAIGGADLFEAEQLWHSIFLALAGPHLYTEFGYGTLNMSNSTVMHIINETNEIFALFNKYNLPSWESMIWTQSMEALISGRVAFFAMGDWATNYAYDFYNVTTYPAIPPYINWPNVTVVVEPFPGTQQYVMFTVDSVGVTANLPPAEEQAALTFVEFWINPTEGNMIWTKWKGESYYLNMPTNYYNTPEQAWAYERLVNITTKNPNYAVYDSGAMLFVSSMTMLQNALKNFQEGVYDLGKLDQTLVQIEKEQNETWLMLNSYGLGYLGFPGHPFDGYLPPWVNSTSGDVPKVTHSATNTNSAMSNKMSNNVNILSNYQVLTALTLITDLVPYQCLTICSKNF